MKMKAAVVTAFGQPLVFDDRDVPTPGDGQVLVKIAASGVCHTDLHAMKGDWPVKLRLPFVPGHEGAGTVAARGAIAAFIADCTIEVERDLSTDTAANGAVSTTTLPSADDSGSI